MHTLDEAKQILYQTVLNLRPGTPLRETPKIFDSSTRETSWGWIFYYNNAQYFETRDFQDMWVGQGPIFFNCSTGEIKVFGSGCNLDNALREYEDELAAVNGFWCLWISDSHSRPEAVFRLKNALAINTADASKLIPIVPFCMFSGKRSHLQWLVTKFAEYSLETYVELHPGDDPALKPFLLPEQMLAPSAAQAYHGKWNVS